jgi:hypothetical protein
VESLVQKKRIGYIEAALLYCESNGVEPEAAASIIQSDKAMIAKIEIEAENLNMMKSKARLPI